MTEMDVKKRWHGRQGAGKFVSNLLMTGSDRKDYQQAQK